MTFRDLLAILLALCFFCGCGSSFSDQFVNTPPVAPPPGGTVEVVLSLQQSRSVKPDVANFRLTLSRATEVIGPVDFARDRASATQVLTVEGVSPGIWDLEILYLDTEGRTVGVFRRLNVEVVSGETLVLRDPDYLNTTVDLFAARVSATSLAPVAASSLALDAGDENDLVVVHQDLKRVSIQAGSLGHFKETLLLDTGNRPAAATNGDFDGDGVDDFAVLNQGDSSVTVYLGNGAGGFAPAGDFAAGAGTSLVAADFNEDGILDLCADSFIQQVAVLIGNGDGSFAAPSFLVAGTFVREVEVGDFNGDQHLDIASGSDLTDNLAVFLGRGDGTFNAALMPTTGQSASRIALSDFDGDQKLDIALTSLNSGDGRLLLGEGDGTFQAPKAFRLSRVSLSLKAGDLNSDGRPDLVSASTDSGIPLGEVEVLYGLGDGTFEPAPVSRLGTSAVALELMDLDGQGDLDIVSVDRSLSSIFAVLDGGLRQAPRYGSMEGISSLVAADFNLDGAPDLAATESGSNFVSILLGRGDGTFPAPEKVDVGGAQVDLVPGDFNGDGNLDLVTPLLLQTPTELVALIGAGDGTFKAFLAGEVEAGAVSVTSADFNNNGSADLLVTSNVGIDSLFGRGDGTFRQGEGVTSAGPTDVVSGDFNGDGNADFAAVEPGRDVVLVSLGEGDGNFRPGADITTESSPGSLFTQDLNGDGFLDLVVGDRSGWSVFRGRGDGSFDGASNIALPRSIVSTGAGDFNNDGILDLAGVDLGVVWIARGQGDGSFHSPEGYAAGSQPNGIVVKDFNRDGNFDLATSNGLGRDISVLLAR